MNEAEPTAEGHAAAAELAALRAASPPQPPGGAGAADAEPTAEPKPPTAIQVETALSDKLQLFRDQADALLKHTANTAAVPCRCGEAPFREPCYWWWSW